MYNSVKLHFTKPSYNVSKYGLKPKRFMDRGKFERRKDSSFFKKAASNYQTEDRFKLLLASNFIYDETCWIGDLSTGEEARNNYLRMKMVLTSLEHYVLEDSWQMFAENQNNLSKILYTEDDLPYIIKKALKREIHPETVVVYDKFFSLLNRVDEKLGSDHIVWERIRHRFFKFSSFVTVETVHPLNNIYDTLRNFVMNKQ